MYFTPQSLYSLGAGAGCTLPPAVANSLTGLVVVAVITVTVPVERDVRDGPPASSLLRRLQAHPAAPVQGARARPVEVVAHPKNSIEAFISSSPGPFPLPDVRDQLTALTHESRQEFDV